MVGVNTLTSVDRAVYSNHCQFWFRLGRKMPEVDFLLNHPYRMSIDNMRNMTAKVAIDNDCDYILFIDDDVLVPVDCLQHLIACDADVAAGWTVIRGYPFKNMFFKFTDESKLNLTNYDEGIKFNDKGLIECAAVGFSCALLRVSTLKKVEPPYFVTGPYNTEDIYYCMKLLAAVPEAKIVVDPGILTSHNLGSEYLDPLSRIAYKVYSEAIDPSLKVENEKPQVISKNHDEPKDGTPTYEDMLKRNF